MKRLVVGVGGASGSVYARRLLDVLAAERIAEVDLVFSKTGRLVWQDEVGTDPSSYGFRVHNPGDMTPAFASGSARYDGMVVVPCSGGGLARIAHGISADLIGRAADVMLKERRPLILVVRESPYSLVHCRNLVAATEAGATILPASPSFYSGPQTVLDLVDTVVARVLDHLGLDHELVRRWSGRVAGATA